VSDQEPKPISAETGSVNAGISHSAGAPADQVAASAAEPANDAPASEAVVSEPVAPEPSMSEPSMSEPALSEPVLAEASKVEPEKAEASAPAPTPEAASETVSHTLAKVVVMPRGDRAWTDRDIHVEAEQAAPQQSLLGKRRASAIAAVVALAAAAGALGGAFATATFMHGDTEVAKAGSATALEASLSRIDADIQALKTGLDHTSKLGMNQFSKTIDRLDKLERAQAEPAARLAKLSEAVDKVHAAPASAAAVAAATPAAASAAKETTGSIGPAPAQQAVTTVPKTDARNDAKTEAKAELGRLPTVEGWVLRDVGYGGALIDGRRGTFEVYAGDMIPGVGRVDAIRRQDGRWVVVTSRGLIVAR
jgi:hypothetical protein